MQHELSIVVPCFNPLQGWAQLLLNRAIEFKAACGQDFQLILVDDASSRRIESDDIAVLKSGLKDFHFLSYEVNRGKGFAVRTGVAATETPFVIYTDIDFPYDTESMLRIWKALKSGEADVAVGSRDEQYYEDTPLRRKAISKIVRFVFRVFFRLPITDTQCGLKGFNRKGRDVFMKTKIERFLFDMEFIARASKSKDLKMVPIPVELRSNIQFSKMNFRILATESVNLFRIFWFANFG